MKKTLLVMLALLMVLSMYSSLAAESDVEDEEFRLDEEIQPFIDTIRPIFVKASLLVGGVFGIYLILLIVRVYYERQNLKLLKDIRYDLDKLNIYHGISYSRGKKTLLKKLFLWIKRSFSSKEEVKVNNHSKKKNKK